MKQVLRFKQEKLCRVAELGSGTGKHWSGLSISCDI